MNKLRLLVFIGAGISLLYSLIHAIVFRMPGRSRDAAKKRLDQADWLDSDSKAGALVKSTGKVGLKDVGDRFVSPLSEIRCVVLHMRALVRKGRGPSGEMVEKIQIKPFVIEDDGTKITVEATHALLDIGPTPPPKTADLHKLFTELGVQTASAASRCEETVVEIGATVTVAGKLVTSPTIKIVGDEANPIVIRTERVRSAVSNEP
ncbi:MAG: hypothetical protein QM831_05970 [Kofleriaceae bacterium]